MSDGSATTAPANSVGRLAIVLHTHMPYVEGFGTWPFGEEWLWRAVAESYLRVADAVAGKSVTVGVTPVLADQFEAMTGDAGDRMLGFFNDSREYVFGEDMRSFYEVGKGELTESLRPQLEDYRSASGRFSGELDRDLVALFDRLGASGVELLGGAATHAVMPLIATDFGADLQLVVGRASHTRRFGESHGIWLPECAYDYGVDELLARHDVEYFCVDQSSVNGYDSLDNLEPIRTPGGPIAIPIDWRTIELVWRDDGYPVADAYRSSFDRTIHSLTPRNNAGEPWNPESARAQAHAHAAAFLRSVAARLEVYEAERGQRGTCVVALDTELLGHWWYEGPWWLEALIEHAPSAGIELVTLGEAVAAADPVERPLGRSSWGEGKTLDTWDSPAVAAMTWQQRASELALHDALVHCDAGRGSPAALRAARELLALQSSDWAFIDKRATAGDYAARRFADHVASFERAHTRLMDRSVNSVRQSAASPGEADSESQLAGLAPELDDDLLQAIVHGFDGSTP